MRLCIICKKPAVDDRRTCGAAICQRKHLKRCKRNARRRAENAILRDLCGTSARAARIDMGLSRR
jgi:hypothetical protein